MENKKCNCDPNNSIFITCSGTADVGYISDQLGRKLSRNKQCKMNCMALFATCNNDKIAESKSKNILVNDGCSEDCEKKVMENKGIGKYFWLRLTDFGYENGKTPASQDTIKQLYDEVEKRLKQEI